MGAPVDFTPRRKLITPTPEQVEQVASKQLVTADVDLDSLQDKAQLILSREIQHLLSASSTAKLDPPSSQDLVRYVKLLQELVDARDQKLAAMPPAELKKHKQNLEHSK